MTLKVITPPSQQISTEDLKTHLRVTHSLEDSLIASYLATAVAVCRGYTHRSIGAQTLELALDEFPTAFQLPFGPVDSIVSVKYVDSSSVLQTMSTGDYSLDNYSDSSVWLIPTDGVIWPVAKKVANAVKVRYIAGDLPPNVKSVLMLMVGMLYDNRSGSINLMEAFPAFKLMLDPAKVKWVMA